MGFDAASAECLIAPPYVVAALWMFACAWYGDQHHVRDPIIIINALLGLIGLPLLGFVESPAARYFGVVSECPNTIQGRDTYVEV